MKKNALLAIGVGGGIAGVLDITQAIILFGKKVPLAIAGRLVSAATQVYYTSFVCLLPSEI